MRKGRTGRMTSSLGRRFVRAALSTIALAASVSILASPAAATDELCPNEDRRNEQGSSYLPDCRAYELVSPPGSRAQRPQAAVDGGAVAWFSFYPPDGTAGQTGSNEYLSRRARDQGRWSTVSVIPPQSPEASANVNCAPSMYLSPSLSRGVLSDGLGSASLAGAGHEPCVAHNEPSLVSEPSSWQSEPEGVQNLFRADIAEGGPGSWQLVNRTRTGVLAGDAWLEDAASQEGNELSDVVFKEAAQLTERAPVGEDLYEWADGAVRLVTFLPNGQPTVGKLANGLGASESDTRSAAAFTHAVSVDGSRVLFTAEGALYVRLHAMREPLQGAVPADQCVASDKACTIQLDASQAGGPGGGATFLTADATGTKVFFSDAPSAELTSDTAAGSGENLYEYEVDTGKLTDLTGGEPNVNVLGYSGFGEQADGAYHLYFVAEGALAVGAIPGRPNLYLVEGQAATPHIAHIATLNAEEDKSDWGTGREVQEESSIELLTSRVSPDGRLIAFTSTEAGPLVGYDNTPAQPAQCAQASTVGGSPSGLCREIFLYEAGAAGPVCVSCHLGAAPRGPSVMDGPSTLQDRRGPGYLSRHVLADGRVFFDSLDALVPEDINGVRDVYEYHEGQVHLISSGTSTGPSAFRDASADGTDVFFTTDQRLLPSDTSDSVSLYDAREAGGFPEPTTAQCEGEGCRTPEPGAPAFLAPASAAVTGFGNLTPPTAAPQIAKKGPLLSRRQKLARALKACQRLRSRRKRLECQRRARRTYGAKAAVRHSSQPPVQHRGDAK
jgi:hypothetical protein